MSIIDARQFFLERTAESMFERVCKPDVLSNTVVELILPHTKEIIEVTEESHKGIFESEIVDKDYVMMTTKYHFHRTTHLGKGIIRIWIYSCWYFDFYTLICDNVIEEHIMPSFESEKKINENIIDSSLRESEQTMSEIKHIEQIISELQPYGN